MPETCTILSTWIPYTLRVHSAPELKVEETRRSRSPGKSLEEFNVDPWRKREEGRRVMNSTPRNRGRSNRLVRVLLCTLSQIAKLVVEDGLSSGDVFIKSGQIPGENLVETRRNEIIDASGWEMKLDRKTSKHLSLHSCECVGPLIVLFNFTLPNPNAFYSTVYVMWWSFVRYIIVCNKIPVLIPGIRAMRLVNYVINFISIDLFSINGS